MERGPLSKSVEHLWLAALQEPDAVEPSPDPENQNNYFDEVNAAAGEGPRRDAATTLFTSSGNHFVFDELHGRSGVSSDRLSIRQQSLGGGGGGGMRAPSPATASIAGVAAAAAAAVAAAAGGGSASPAAVAASAPSAAPVALSPVPKAVRGDLVGAVSAVVEEVTAHERQELADEFINLFRRPNKALSSAVKQLEDMLRYYPALMFIQRCEGEAHGQSLELCCARDAVIHAVKNDARFPNLVFTSFERGLKHAGLYVTQSTHGKVPLKRWAFKDGAAGGGAPSSASKKKARNRKRSRLDGADDGGRELVVSSDMTAEAVAVALVVAGNAPAVAAAVQDANAEAVKKVKVDDNQQHVEK